MLERGVLVAPAQALLIGGSKAQQVAEGSELPGRGEREKNLFEL